MCLGSAVASHRFKYFLRAGLAMPLELPEVFRMLSSFVRRVFALPGVHSAHGIVVEAAGTLNELIGAVFLNVVCQHMARCVLCLRSLLQQ